MYKYVVDNEFVGGNGGSTSFTANKIQDGHLLRKLTVWYDGDEYKIRGIDIEYTDGSHASYGQQKTKSSSITFSPGETVTSMTLWDTDHGSSSRFGRIEMQTNNGGELAWGRVPTGNPPHYVTLGSGLLAGFEGRYGLDIDKIKPLFLKEVERIVSSPTYDLPSAGNGIVPTSVSDDQIENDGADQIQHTLSGSYSISRTNSWEQASGTTFGMEMSVTAGIPEVVEVSSGFNWEVSESSSHASSETSEETLEWSTVVTVQPGKSKYLLATAGKGRLDISYTSTVYITLMDGNTLSYSEKGKFKNVAYSRVLTRVDDKPISQKPPPDGGAPKVPKEAA